MRDSLTETKGTRRMNLIVAADENWGIGKDGGLLTHLPGDLKYFKEKTMGKVVVMGRATLESLPGARPLPQRTNIILTRDASLQREGCIVVHSMQQLLEECAKYDPDDVMIIGGEQIYMQLIRQCERLFITKIFASFDADKHIMNVDKMQSFVLACESDVMEENGICYQFLEYRKKA